MSAIHSAFQYMKERKRDMKREQEGVLVHVQGVEKRAKWKNGGENIFPWRDEKNKNKRERFLTWCMPVLPDG